MIQLNLLPEVKLQYMRTRSLKRTITVVSALIAGSALTIFILMFVTVAIFQKNHLKNLSADIQTDSKKLQDTKDLNKVLTIQNQLKSLPELHNKKPVTSRLFTYVAQVTPNQVSIGKLDLDYQAKTLTFSGTTDSISTINKFVDTLKFTTFSYPDSTGQAQTGKPFSNVVLTSFSRTDKNATYEIATSFDSAIFDSAKQMTLSVPKIISTRSETEKPTDLFQALPEPKTKATN